ncbi:MAG: 2-oxoglutarate and iron-dependent oxygenase domain-containing protein, partial [Saprospiraceae bacterium]|nr:2-oxoglutarate and iron-dependent oxygenase domain-containing protein [Saprospiraceae bacterium]
MTKRAVPVVDLATFTRGNDEERQAFVNRLGDAFRHIGFVTVKNHGIPKSLIDGFYALSKEFFELPESVKKKYEIEGLAGQRGYTSFGTEHAKHSEVPDLKEFYQIGQEVTDGDPIVKEYPNNVHVEELPDFTRTAIQLYKQFEESGRNLLRAIALYLDLDEGYFDPEVHNGNSILRAIYYPPITREPQSAIRAEQHEDINLITLLV